jgi:hypothetical protein
MDCRVKPGNDNAEDGARIERVARARFYFFPVTMRTYFSNAASCALIMSTAA